MTIGTAWGDLKDATPEIVRAEAMARAEIACEPIYKWRTTINGSNPPETGLGPLALLCLLTPSLNPPCYTMYFYLTLTLFLTHFSHNRVLSLTTAPL